MEEIKHMNMNAIEGPQHFFNRYGPFALAPSKSSLCPHPCSTQPFAHFSCVTDRHFLTNIFLSMPYDLFSHFLRHAVGIF